MNRLHHRDPESRDRSTEVLGQPTGGFTVRRITVLSRAAAIVDEADGEATRNRELRRLRGQIQRLEEEKEDLTRRLAFVERELEKARAKIPRGLSTS